MAKIDTLIQAARTKHEESEGEDKVKAKAALEALESVKGAGIEHDHDEINGIITRKVKAEADGWEEMVGMSREETKELFEEFDREGFESLLGGGEGDGKAKGDGEGDGGEANAGSTLAKVQRALEARDAKIAEQGTALGEFQQRLARKEIDGAMKDALRSAGINDSFMDPALKLAGYEDLVEKLCSGKEVTSEEVSGKVEGVKNLSGVWFGDHVPQNDPTLLPGGYRLKPEAIKPGIEATPRASDPTEITASEREARSSSAF